MSTTNLDSANLKAVADNGLIREEVMNQIWDISSIPLPFTDMISSDSIKNSYSEWTEDTLQAIDPDNAAIDGADLTGDDSNTGLRVGNHAQISTKIVAVSTRAIESDTIGRSDELSYQVMMRQRELRRDVEAIMCGQQASIADDGSVTAGLSAGFGAWLTTNAVRGATGADGGYGATSPGIVDTPTPGTVRALTETLIRDVAQAVYEEGGNPTKLMSTPGAIRGLSEYMFSSSARIATLTSETTQSKEAATAKGAVNVFLTDFGVVMEMIPNRLQQLADTTNVNVFIIDPEYVRQGFLHGYRVEPQAKTGLSEKRQMIVDWTLKVLTEKAHGVVADVNPALAVTT